METGGKGALEPAGECAELQGDGDMPSPKAPPRLEETAPEAVQEEDRTRPLNSRRGSSQRIRQRSTSRRGSIRSRRGTSSTPTMGFNSAAPTPMRQRRASLGGRQRRGSMSNAGEQASASLALNQATLRDVRGQNANLEARLREATENRTEADDCIRQLRAAIKDKDQNFAKYRESTLEAHQRSNAVIKAGMMLNDICIGLQTALGRCEGARINTNKSSLMPEAYKNPLQLVEHCKDVIELQLDKWDKDKKEMKDQVKTAEAGRDARAKAFDEEEEAFNAERDELNEQVRALEAEIEIIEHSHEQEKALAREKYNEGEAAWRETEQGKQAAETERDELREQLKRKDRDLAEQFEKLVEYPRQSEEMAQRMDRTVKACRREKNLVELERKEFKRQYALFLRVYSSNKELNNVVQQLQSEKVVLKHRLAAVAAQHGATERVKVMKAVDKVQQEKAVVAQEVSRLKVASKEKGHALAKLEKEVQSLRQALRVASEKHRGLVEKQGGQPKEMEMLVENCPELREYLDKMEKAGLGKEEFHKQKTRLLKMLDRDEEADVTRDLVREVSQLRKSNAELQGRVKWLEKVEAATRESARTAAAAREQGVGGGGGGAAQDVGVVVHEDGLSGIRQSSNRKVDFLLSQDGSGTTDRVSVEQRGLHRPRSQQISQRPAPQRQRPASASAYRSSPLAGGGGGGSRREVVPGTRKRGRKPSTQGRFRSRFQQLQGRRGRQGREEGEEEEEVDQEEEEDAQHFSLDDSHLPSGLKMFQEEYRPLKLPTEEHEGSEATEELSDSDSFHRVMSGAVVEDGGGIGLDLARVGGCGKVSGAVDRAVDRAVMGSAATQHQGASFSQGITVTPGVVRPQSAKSTAGSAAAAAAAASKSGRASGGKRGSGSTGGRKGLPTRPQSANASTRAWGDTLHA